MTRIKARLHSYQEQCVNFLIDTPNAALLLDMG